MEFQKECNEFMTLNGMEGIKGIQWNIKWKESKGFVNGVLMEFNGIQWNPIRSGKNHYDSIEFRNGWKESIIFNGI